MLNTILSPSMVQEPKKLFCGACPETDPSGVIIIVMSVPGIYQSPAGDWVSVLMQPAAATMPTRASAKTTNAVFLILHHWTPEYIYVA